MVANTNPNVFARNIGAETPTLLQVGRAPPKCVLSFGGCGWLFVFGLGVAKYLLEEKKEWAQQCHLAGAGSGSIPAIVLACQGAARPDSVVEDVVSHPPFRLDSREDYRRQELKAALEKHLPKDVASMLNGRACIAVGMSNRDLGFRKQPREVQLYGHHICSFPNREDVINCVLAATAPDTHNPPLYRGEKVMRATWMSLSTELDTAIRHVFVHGYCGFSFAASRTRHNMVFGRNGLIVNTTENAISQTLTAMRPDLFPAVRKDALSRAYENGFHAARRYERWEEDSYMFAKPDRSPGDDKNWREIRKALFSKHTT